MQRLTFSLDDPLAAAFDQLMRQNGYASRSEAFRDMLRRELGRQAAAAEPDTPFIAVLSYVYDHHERQLSSRLTELQHDHHELTVSTMHAHLSHAECVETVILRGPLRLLETFAQSVIAQTGVRHGSINLIPLESAP
ncbi:nickel-responsive transcriptional regulator NikR [Martelella alba]|uniref:Putative nickel-responsive regulator n=1 Tax=Martelella alba TaxID=2590451 RepID=A0ABY2SKQ0_9HYPH|nr:nickel-responsive transcriptional regulator NikR [Martelella alba]TKI05327.1 nickel-responsive transcriptional regulator NikR [Martelella alba]